jgi:tRNA wybutosine-synthesizing protein 1
MSDSEGGPKQVDDPNYHTAAQTRGWTRNALRGEGKCYNSMASSHTAVSR